MSTKTAKQVVSKLPEVPAKYTADTELDEIFNKMLETADGDSLNFLKDNLLARLKEKKGTYSPKMLEFLTMSDEDLAKFMIEDWLHREDEASGKKGDLDAAMNLMEAVHEFKNEFRIAFSGNDTSHEWWAKF